MRWKHSPKPVAGDTRRKTRFLFFPLHINGQSRWFEVCTFTEEYKVVTTKATQYSTWDKVVTTKATQYSTWVPVGWVDA